MILTLLERLELHEERSIELFANNIVCTGQIFLGNPHETPFIPTWNHDHSADPSFIPDVNAAAKADDEE